MKCVSYNIQFGFGQDAQFDLERIVDAVRGADVIALQEVTRNSPMNGGRDLVADIRAMLPDYFAAFGPNLEAEIGSHVKNGKAVDVRLEFGNMILSKTPILLSRNLLLPRTRSYDRVNLQRGALEAMIDTPFGPVRFYSTHLDHRGADERMAQVRFLMDRLLAYPLEGGAISGISEMGFPEPPTPEAYVLMGDFNMLEGSPEYHLVAGTPDHEFGTPLVARHAVDAALRVGGAPQPTCVNLEDPADASLHKRIDYCFVHPLLASKIKAFHVDVEAVGSDHRPLWLELG
ncbi:EEP domain-containing protein [Mesorhizobium microcysteis]|uniref:EEP domain-containing protein n=1 Tax=Neoaquamicrobium microcysteis TaxID=2682781 RepID=A0A5D4GZK3_9HYPH|nr:endonuclease/exonuclease/phosphatase family protein [Mesorhizobium microcysteis]TYR34066.1 EEP domain-containing protein [Mesorhizobium microcysteis]